MRLLILVVTLVSQYNGEPHTEVVYTSDTHYTGPLPPPPPPSFVPSADLPPLFLSNNGTKITTIEQWEALRRPELKQLMFDYILGAPPKQPPPNLKSSTVLNTTTRGDFVFTFYNLVWGTPTTHRKEPCSFDIELVCPSTTLSGKTKFPLFMTQWNHREWALDAAQRMYCGCIYPGADTRDATPQFGEAYPAATWMKIVKRAWLGSRALDFLLTLPQIDSKNVGITGHSRNGKQSLIAAALDDRITAVLGSSPGAPISAPYHFSSREYFGETPEFIGPGRNWWLPSCKYFIGQEHLLPADGHFITALIAPRHAGVYSGHNDREGDLSFADERNHLASRAVWNMYGGEDFAKSHFHHLYRPGDHHGFLSISTILDWFDFSFGLRGVKEPQSELLHISFVWSEWLAKSTFDRSNMPTNSSSHSLDYKISWVLGGNADVDYEKTFNLEDWLYSPGSSYCEEWPYIVSLLQHDTWILEPRKTTAVSRTAFAFGSYIVGNAYYPTAHPKSEPLPAVIFLHPFSYNTGYVPVYSTINASYADTGDMHHFIASQNYVVFTYDQAGFGIHVPEKRHFYNRYMGQSLFGRQVMNVQEIINLVLCLTAESRGKGMCSSGEVPTGTYPDHFGEIPNIDTNKIFVVGYGLGGSLALHAAALFSEHIAGVATFAGWTPMRHDANTETTGGNQRFYDWHALTPRLGLYEGKEGTIPYDYSDLLKTFAPKPTLVYAPVRDRSNTLKYVLNTLNEVKPAWSSAPANLKVETPDTYSHFRNMEIQALLKWLTENK